MSVKRMALSLALVLLVFLALDAVWLTLAADRLYRPGIGHLMREGFALLPAALFYLLYGAALVYFVILPARGSLHALGRGAFFGLVAYATYDLTNQATMINWPWRVTIADLVWGAFVTGTSCAITRRLMGRL